MSLKVYIEIPILVTNDLEHCDTDCHFFGRGDCNLFHVGLIYDEEAEAPKRAKACRKQKIRRDEEDDE